MVPRPVCISPACLCSVRMPPGKAASVPTGPVHLMTGVPAKHPPWPGALPALLCTSPQAVIWEGPQTSSPRDRTPTRPGKQDPRGQDGGSLAGLSSPTEGLLPHFPGRRKWPGSACSQGHSSLPFRPVSFIRLFCSEFTKLSLPLPSISTLPPSQSGAGRIRCYILGPAGVSHPHPLFPPPHSRPPPHPRCMQHRGGCPIPWRPLLVKPGSTTPRLCLAPQVSVDRGADRGGRAPQLVGEERWNRAAAPAQFIGASLGAEGGPLPGPARQGGTASNPSPGKSAGRSEGGALSQPRALGVLGAPGAVSGRGVQREQLLPAGGDGI